MLYSMRELLANAADNKYAVGYFEAFNMDSMLAVLDAAEQKNSPIIIGFGGQFIGSKNRKVKENIYHYGVLASEAAKRSSVPCAVILNEADEIDMVYQGMQAGFNAVMYQKPGEDFNDTVCITKEVCKVAHMLNIDVESEIGELPCADISNDTQTKGKMTDVDQAEFYVNETGIDALAISIGNVHLLEGKTSTLDFDLLNELQNRISIPLVLHGGTGISPQDMKMAISHGISKINIGTVLKREYINAIKNYYAKNDFNNLDPHNIIGRGGNEDMLSVGRSAISKKVIEFIEIFGSTDKADLFNILKNRA